MNDVKDYISVITAVIESCCAGAIVYGWSSLNYILTKEGYFDSSCNSSLYNSSNSSDVVVCARQQYYLGLVFTLAVSIPPSLCILVGKLLDLYGTWLLRSVSSVLFMLSCSAIALSSSKTSWILYPATIAIGICGYVILITNTQLANLFPNHRGVVTNVINGAVNASLAVFTLVKIAYENGYSLKFLFLLLTAVGPFMFIRTFLLMPKTIVPFNVPTNYYYGIKELRSKNKFRSADWSEETNLLESTSRSTNGGKDNAELKLHALSLLYFFGVYSFSIQVLRMNFFIETLNIKLFVMFPHNLSAVDYNLSVFGYLQFISLLFALFVGFQYDTLSKKLKKLKYTNFQAQMKALALENLYASLALILYTLFTTFWYNPLQYVSYVVSILSQNLAYSTLGLFLIQCFPMKYFGTLYGLALLFSAVVTTLQFPFYFLATHCFHNNFLIVDIILLILAFMTFLHPIDLYKRSKG